MAVSPDDPYIQTKTGAGNARLFPSSEYVVLLRNLVKDSGIYVLASLTSPLVALVLAPFLTRDLSSSAYGALAVLTTMVSLVAGFTQLGLGSAFFRSYNFDYESRKDRDAVLSTVIVLLTLLSLPVTLLMAALAPGLASILLTKSSFGSAMLFAALAILMQNLTIPGFSWLRAESRAILFSLLSIGNLLVVLVGTIVLVGSMHMGINGSLLATASGYALVAVCTLPAILWRAGLRFRVDIAKGLLSFGLPNVANLLAVWVLQLSDRYLLARFTSLSQVASYNVAYTLGGVLATVIITPFTLAWPTAMYAIAKRKDAGRVFQIIFRWFGLLLLLAAYGFALVCIGLLDFFFPPAYHVSAPIIPIIAESIMFFGIYNIFVTGGAIRRKTWLAVLFTGTSALCNVLLNFLLIPLYGSMGAALSTLFAYIVLAGFAYIVNQRIYHIPYQIGLFIFAFVLGVAFFGVSDFLTRAQGFLTTAALYLGSFCLYGGCIVLLLWLQGRFRKGQNELYRRRSTSEDA